MKYELFKVTYSAVGFRNNRNARYRLDVAFNNERHRLYYDNYSALVSYLKMFNRLFK